MLIVVGEPDPPACEVVETDDELGRRQQPLEQIDEHVPFEVENLAQFVHQASEAVRHLHEVRQSEQLQCLAR